MRWVWYMGQNMSIKMMAMSCAVCCDGCDLWDSITAKILCLRLICLVVVGVMGSKVVQWFGYGLCVLCVWRLWTQAREHLHMGQLDEPDSTTCAAWNLLLVGAKSCWRAAYPTAKQSLAVFTRRNQRHASSMHMCTSGCARGWASAAGAPVCVKPVPGALLMAGYHLARKWLSPRLLLRLASKPRYVADGERTLAGFAICYPA